MEKFDSFNESCIKNLRCGNSNLDKVAYMALLGEDSAKGAVTKIELLNQVTTETTDLRDYNDFSNVVKEENFYSVKYFVRVTFNTEISSNFGIEDTQLTLQVKDIKAQNYLAYALNKLI